MAEFRGKEKKKDRMQKGNQYKRELIFGSSIFNQILNTKNRT